MVCLLLNVQTVERPLLPRCEVGADLALKSINYNYNIPRPTPVTPRNDGAREFVNKPQRVSQQGQNARRHLEPDWANRNQCPKHQRHRQEQQPDQK